MPDTGTDCGRVTPGCSRARLVGNGVRPKKAPSKRVAPSRRLTCVCTTTPLAARTVDGSTARSAARCSLDLLHRCCQKGRSALPVPIHVPQLDGAVVAQREQRAAVGRVAEGDN